MLGVACTPSSNLTPAGKAAARFTYPDGIFLSVPIDTFFFSPVVKAVTVFHCETDMTRPLVMA
jgi:hypothetical protein